MEPSINKNTKEFVIGLYHEINSSLETHIEIETTFVKEFASIEEATKYINVDVGKDGAYLCDGYLLFKSGDETLMFRNEDKGNYKISKLTKELPTAELVGELTNEEIRKRFGDKAFWITTDDYEQMDYSLSDLFELLKKQDSSADSFTLSSLAYKCHPIDEDIMWIPGKISGVIEG